MTSLSRAEYAQLYGPTTGDRIRLADTDLWIEVEADDTEPGEELIGGCGKTARHGALVEQLAPTAPRALDMIVLGVVLLDPVLGIRKTYIGIKDGRVVGVGRAGNPDVQDGVELEVDAHTAMITGEGLIATPGHRRLARPSVQRRPGAGGAVGGRHDDRRDGHRRGLGRRREPPPQPAHPDRRLGGRSGQRRVPGPRLVHLGRAAGAGGAVGLRRLQGARGLGRHSRRRSTPASPWPSRSTSRWPCTPTR